MGAFLCGGWGQRLGHLVFRLLWGPRFLQPCADSGQDVMEGGRDRGVLRRIAPGARWYPAGVSGSCSMVMVDAALSSGVHRCGLWSRGWTVMAW